MQCTYMHHRRRINTKVDATVWGTEFNQLLATLAILYQDDLKKRINTIMATWLNVYFGKMAETYTKPLAPSQNESSPTFIQIILAAVKFMASAAFRFVPPPTATTFAFKLLYL